MPGNLDYYLHCSYEVNNRRYSSRLLEDLGTYSKTIVSDQRMRLFLRHVLITGCLLLLTTGVFTFWLHISDKADSSLIAERYRSAFDDGAILKMDYPYYKWVCSRDNLAGLDQFTECFYVLMTMYSSHNSNWQDSLMGRYYAQKNNAPTCEQAYRVVNTPPEELNNEKLWEIKQKPRLWHGVKAVLSSMLPYFHLSQIHWLIKISTFWGLALIGCQVMYFEKKLGAAFILYTFTAFYCSSILFFGGVAYSVPFLNVIIWLNIWILYRLQRPKEVRGNLEMSIIVLGGTANSFFYQLDGSLIFAISMIFFVETFMAPSGLRYLSLKRSFMTCIIYSAGFFGSIFCKQAVLILSQQSFDVAYDFFNFIALRMSDSNGNNNNLTVMHIINGQFQWYGLAGYGINSIHKFIIYSKIFFWINTVVSLLILAWLKVQNERKLLEEHSVALIGFLLMVGTVMLRYAVMKNHSDIHVFFVNRYLFVFAGSTYFYSVWLLLCSPAIRHYRNS